MDVEEEKIRSAHSAGTLDLPAVDPFENNNSNINNDQHDTEEEEEAYLVPDHAVVKYFERVLGYDVEEIRDKIRHMADEAVPFKKCDGAFHQATGTVLFFSEDGEAVVIFYRVSSLKNTWVET